MPFLSRDQEQAIRSFYSNHERQEEYLLLLRSLGSFLEREVQPEAERVDRERSFPRRSITKLFEMDFAAMSFPEEFGGLQLPFLLYVAAMELVAKACPSTAISLAIHGTACEGIRLFGSESLRRRFLKPLIRGEKLAAFALTEPGSGSDARAMRTKASRAGNRYVLDGAKMFITNAGVADVYFVFARTEKGPSAFLVEKETPGLVLGRDIDKLGVRGSKLMDLAFKECAVPEENLVGVEGEGFEYAKRMLSGGRITIAALSLGIAQAAYERALRYALERRAFGQPIANFQLIKQKLAEMATQINAARLLTYHAAHVKDRSESGYECEAAQAKLFASSAALRACDEAIQIFGGYGYADEVNVHRHWRDARLMTIGEGTSEIMQLIIAKHVIRQAKIEADKP